MAIGPIFFVLKINIQVAVHR